MLKPVSKACLLLVASLFPALAHAASLGRVTVNSTLGQPFDAEINLIAVEKEEKASLTVRLAPQEIFRQVNVDYVSLLSTFKASIENRSNGSPYIRIVSPQPVSEPLLHILIELSGLSARVLREYTVVLAPPEIDAHPPIIPVSQIHLPASVKAESAAAERSGLPLKNPITVENKLTLEIAPTGKAHTVYGPVKHGDTLTGIVKNIVPPSGVSFNQLLVAVHRANRDAFFGSNMHQLKTGPILRIPDNSEIGAVTAEEADKELKNQTVDWNRQRASGVIETIKEPKQTDTGKIEPAADAQIGKSPATPHGFPKPFQGEESWNAGNNMGVTGPGGNGMGEKSIVGKRVNGKNSDGMGWR